MLVYTAAEDYIQLNLPRMLSELTKGDKEVYALSINIFKIPFGAENANFAMVYISVINVKLEHKQDFLDQMEENFGLKPAWLTKDEAYIQDESGRIFGNFNLAYKVPVDLLEQLAVLYKMTI